MFERRRFTHCDRCECTFLGGNPGELCLTSGCPGTLRLVEAHEPYTQQDIARAVQGMLTTSEWLLAWSSHDGQLYSVSPMMAVKQGLMARAIAISFKANKAKETFSVRMECAHQREIAPLLCGYEWCVDCGSVKHVNDDEWRTPRGLTP